MGRKRDDHSVYGLKFISDADFESYVAENLCAMRRYVHYKDFTHPVVDPVKWAFLCQLFNQTNGEAVDLEARRQVEKSNNNVIGYFHQNIFRYAPSDWSIPAEGKGGGFDLINERRHIYVEIKNGTHHNSSEQAGLWMRMKRAVDLDADAMCYLVEVLAPKSGERPFERAPEGRVKGALNGLPPDDKPQIISEMDDLLDDFDDSDWHGSNFTDTYEQRDMEGDEWGRNSISMLGSIQQTDPQALTPDELKYRDRIRRASMDWLYEQVWGDRQYFFDMLEALPLAIWNVAEGCKYKDTEPTESVQFILDKKGFELNNRDSEESYEAYNELYCHWLELCYKAYKDRAAER